MLKNILFIIFSFVSLTMFSQNRLSIGDGLEQSITVGSIPVTDVSNKQSYLAPGTNAQILQIIGGVPTWQTNAGGEQTTVTDQANGVDIGLIGFDITVGLNIAELGVAVSVDGANDYIAIFDDSAGDEQRVTIQSLAAGINLSDLSDIPNEPTGGSSSYVLTWDDSGDAFSWELVPESNLIGVGDMVFLSGLSITIATTTLTSPLPQFTVDDIGKAVIIHGAGTGTDGNLGDELTTTISSFNSTTSVELSVTATVTVSSVDGVMGTDNTPLFQSSAVSSSNIIINPISTTKKFLFSSVVDFNLLTNISVTGQGDTLLFVSANPNSYIGGNEPDKNLFKVDSCNSVLFENFIGKNIGQTFVRPVTAQEGGYWTVLNSVATPYNRHYNKQANHGMVVDFQNSKNITLRNVTSINTGGLVRAFPGSFPYANEHLLVEDCHVYGWGGTAVYPCDYTTIEKSHLDNEQAPPIDLDDQSNSLGSSHVIYSTSGYRDIKIHGNELRFCRGTAIQWNTGTGRISSNNIVSDNGFYDCSRSGSLVGDSDPLQIDFTGNTYYRSGRYLISAAGGDFNFTGEQWDSSYSENNLTLGAYNIADAKHVKISESKFRRVAEDGNNAVITTSGHISSVDYEVIIQDCYFDSLNVRSYMNLLEHDSLKNGTITLKGNEFQAPVFLMGTAAIPGTMDGDGIDKFFITGNTFRVKDVDQLVMRFGANIIDNDFYIYGSNFGININYIALDDSSNIVSNRFHNITGGNIIFLASGAQNNLSTWYDGNTVVGNHSFTGTGGNEVEQGINFFNGKLGVGAGAYTAITSMEPLTFSGQPSVFGIMQRLKSESTVSYSQYYNSITGDFSTSDGLTVGINGLNGTVNNRENGALFLATNGEQVVSISANFDFTIVKDDHVNAGLFFDSSTGFLEVDEYDSGYVLDEAPTNIAWFDETTGQVQKSNIDSLIVAINSSLVIPHAASYTFKSRPGANGVFYIAGFYEAPATDANLTQASLTQIQGTANVSYAAHAFVVAAAAGVTDGSDLVLTVSGTSITDLGVRTPADSEVVVATCTGASTNQYFETSIKWIGQVTYTLTSTGGGTFNFDFNYGFSKYDDRGNRDFTVTGFDVTGLANNSDTGFNIELLKHSAAGWTYAATGFAPGNGNITNMNTDYVNEINIQDGEYFAYKRTELNTAINGADGEGYIVRVTTAVNNSVEYLNIVVGSNLPVN